MTQPIRIANSHIGVTNIVEHKSVRKIMVNTFTTLADTLEAHCGPKSKFAAIIEYQGVAAEPKFTKDGINIIRSIKFVNPIQEVVREMVVHVGDRIERAGGDGTTSSMILVCRTLATLLNHPKIRQLGYTELVTAFNEFLYRLEQGFYPDQVWTVDTVMEVFELTEDQAAKAIAYSQAYSSAHGDVEVARAIAEMFESLGRKGWKYAYVEHNRYESQDRVKVVIDKNQFRTTAYIQSKTMFTDPVSKTFSATGANVLVATEPLAFGLLQTEMILEAIRQAYANKTQLVVILPDSIDAHHAGMLSSMAQQAAWNGVTIFTLPRQPPKFNDLTVLLYVAKTPLFVIGKGDPVLLQNVSVEFSNDDLRLNSLYENPNNTRQHPAIVDPSDPYHKDIVGLAEMMERTLEDRLKSEKGESQGRLDTNIQELRRLYAKLTLAQRPYLYVGGLAYENKALGDVVRDALTSTYQSLANGFVLGGNKGLFAALHEFQDNNPTEMDEVFLEAWLAGIRSVYRVTHGLPRLTWWDTVKDGLHAVADDFCLNPRRPCSEAYITSSYNLCSSHPIPHDIEDGRWLNAYDPSANEERVLIMQPAVVDRELLHRFSEVALRFLMTERVIMPPDHAVMNQSK